MLVNRQIQSVFSAVLIQLDIQLSMCRSRKIVEGIICNIFNMMEDINAE